MNIFIQKYSSIQLEISGILKSNDVFEKKILR